MKNWTIALCALVLCGCDPYGYNRFNSLDAQFQIYIGFHKVCLDKLWSDMQLRPYDKKDWESAKYKNSNTGEHSYDIKFNNIDGAGSAILCTLNVDDLSDVRLRVIEANNIKEPSGTKER